MRSAIVLLLAAATTVAPAPGDRERLTIPVWLDSRFTPAERAEVLEGLSAWATAVPQAEIVIVDEREPNPSRTFAPMLARLWSDLPVTVDRESWDANRGFLGWVAEHGRGQMHLVPDAFPAGSCPATTLRWVTAHELGHALGLRHREDVPAGKSLMGTPCEAQALRIDEETLDRVASAWDLDRSRMRAFP